METLVWLHCRRVHQLCRRKKRKIHKLLVKKGKFTISLTSRVTGVYLPEFYKCSMRHLRDVISGRKEFFYTREIKKTVVEYRKELTVNKVYEMIKLNPRFMAYVPSINEEKYDAEDVFD